MIGLEVAPAHIINRYVYDLLRTNGAIGTRTADYGGKTPIIPPQQLPEFTALNKPFLVYGFSEDATRDLYAMKSGVLSYAVYSTDDRQIIRIINVIQQALGRTDESARDLNDYVNDGLAAPGSPLRGPTFLSIELGLSEGPGPTEQEGGRQAGVVVIRYSYKTDLVVNARPTVT